MSDKFLTDKDYHDAVLKAHELYRQDGEHGPTSKESYQEAMRAFRRVGMQRPTWPDDYDHHLLSDSAERMFLPEAIRTQEQYRQWTLRKLYWGEDVDFKHHRYLIVGGTHFTIIDRGDALEYQDEFIIRENGAAEKGPSWLLLKLGGKAVYREFPALYEAFDAILEHYGL